MWGSSFFRQIPTHSNLKFSFFKPFAISSQSWGSRFSSNFRSGTCKEGKECLWNSKRGIGIGVSGAIPLEETRPAGISNFDPKKTQQHSPLSSKTFPEKTLLFCHLSAAAYLKPSEIREMRSVWPQYDDFSVRFIANGGSEAFLFENQFDVVLACRGTEASSLCDILTDLKIHQMNCKTGHGKVHHGFQTYVDNLWPELVHHISANPEREKKNFWITGHSLGAAMGTVVAKQCVELSDLKKPKALFTFGSPRVGNRIFSEFLDAHIEHFRFVNQGDIVTKIPSGWRFSHCGKKWGNQYQSENGQHVTVAELKIDETDSKSFLYSLFVPLQTLFNLVNVIDDFHSHSIDGYRTNLANWVDMTNK